jgi:hypothetical protein
MLVDGIFAQMKRMPMGVNPRLSSRVTFYTLPTSKSGNAEFLQETELRKKTVSERYEIEDFAIDPGQDLLVLLEYKYVRYDIGLTELAHALTFPVLQHRKSNFTVAPCHPILPTHWLVPAPGVVQTLSIPADT